MFGMPEAIDVDETVLSNRRTENTLLRIAAGVLVLILFVSWLPTIVTALILRGNLPDLLLVLVGGLESLLLLIFSVTVQNIFLQMLALPNSFGRALARWSKPVWGIAFLGATFVFLHTLLNPRGELAAALASTNVIVFLVTIFLFLVFTLLVWAFFLIVNSLRNEPVAHPVNDRAPALAAKKSTIWVWFLVVGMVVCCLCVCLIAVIAVIYSQGINISR